MPAYFSPEEAVKIIQSGNNVFIQGSAATPLTLLHALSQRAPELKKVNLISISTLGDIDFDNPEYADSFFINSLFVSSNVRSAIHEGRGDYIPAFLSEIPSLFDQGILKIDVALIHVSPPDQHGYCSLGVSVDVARAGVRNAAYVIAQVNPKMPRTHGDGLIHESKINSFVACNDPLPEVDYGKEAGESEKKIGSFCAELIEDGATLQLGIGSIPDAVLECLENHKSLGIHSEMFSNGVMDLMKKGVVTNEFKKKHKGKTATGFCIGSRELYDFVDDNPAFSFLEAGYVNNPHVISQNPKVVAINSAIEIDLTGQVCSDSIGTYQYSGVGGQMDFIRGASLSPGGKPIIAMNSCASKGQSKIVSFLKNGAGVVTTRAHIHYVVTEFGIAFLYGKNLRERAKDLIRISAPQHREQLEKEAFERFGPTFYSAGN